MSVTNYRIYSNFTYITGDWEPEVGSEGFYAEGFYAFMLLCRSRKSEVNMFLSAFMLDVLFLASGYLPLCN
jgi:hypothetical protein